MAKIDKEALKKHKFWIGLGVFVLIWLIGIIVVKAGGDDKAKKDWESAKTKIEAAKKAGPKTEAYQTPWKLHGAKFRKHKDHIWQLAWQQQASLFTWPDGMKVKPNYPQDSFGADSATDVNNRGTFRTDYKEQFAGLEEYVYPAEFSGGFTAVFPQQKWNATRAPTREEIWLAQEDFWVRREMLVMIRTALDATAWFRDQRFMELLEAPVVEAPKPAPPTPATPATQPVPGVTPKDKPPEQPTDSGLRTFKNAMCELKLKFTKAGKLWVLKAAAARDLYKPEEKSRRFRIVLGPDKKDHPEFDVTVDKATFDKTDPAAFEKAAPIAAKEAISVDPLAFEKQADPAKQKLLRVEEVFPVAEGFVGRSVFCNANWKLDLLYIKAEKSNGWDISEKSTIKNINVSHKTQPLANLATNKGLPFMLIKGSATYLMRISGLPLAFEQEASLPRRYEVQTVRLDKNGPDDPPLYVEQKLDWDISPIRRIDKLALSVHSHRTVHLGLHAWTDLKKLDPDTSEGEGEKAGTSGNTSGTPPQAGGPSPPGGALGGKGGATPPGGSGMGGMGGRGESDKNKPDNTRVTEIPRNRYLQVTPQCRHLPIAMRLVVDQAHINDVLAAVANSRLRVQITQVSLLHVNDVKRGEAAPASGDTGTGTGTGAKIGGAKGPGSFGGSMGKPPMGLSGPGGKGGGAGGAYGMSGMGPRRGSGGPPMAGSAFMANRPTGALADDRGPRKPPTVGGAAGAGKADEKRQIKDPTRLIELTIYGIASLYDRYPPRSQPAAAPGTTTPAPIK